jgi:hypothetical protein
MTSEALLNVGVPMAIGWCTWVSVSVFKHAQEIALMKQEMKLLEDVKEVLGVIKEEMKFRNHSFKNKDA